MDVLSEVLRVVKLEGALFFNGEFSAPWCLSSSQSSAAAASLSSVAGHMILFHFLTEGRAYVKLADGQRVELIAGDIVVIPHGDAHVLANGPYAKPIDTRQVFGKNVTQGFSNSRALAAVGRSLNSSAATWPATRG